jgi:hypothetical protein
MNPPNPFGQKTSQPNPQFNTFLESLREKSGYEPTSSKPSFIEQLNHKKEIEKRRVAEFHRSRLQEWHSLYSSKEKETQKAIEEIRLELKRLAKDIIKFDTTINQTIFSPIQKPGIYHQTLLEHIRQVIFVIRQQIADSNSWLNLYRQKAKKQGHYWQQAGKGGSSFMLNNERQIATAVG